MFNIHVRGTDGQCLWMSSWGMDHKYVWYMLCKSIELLKRALFFTKLYVSVPQNPSSKGLRLCWWRIFWHLWQFGCSWNFQDLNTGLHRQSLTNNTGWGKINRASNLHAIKQVFLMFFLPLHHPNKCFENIYVLLLCLITANKIHEPRKWIILYHAFWTCLNSNWTIMRKTEISRVLKCTTHTLNVNVNKPGAVLFTLSVYLFFYMHLWTGQLAFALFHRMINFK